MARRRRGARLDPYEGLDGLADRLSDAAKGEARLPVAEAVAGKLYELTINTAIHHVDTGLMLQTLDFFADPGQAGVSMQPYKRFVDGLEIRAGIPRKWRPPLQEAGRQAIVDFIGKAK